jgi:hypothetical protein
MGHAPRLLGDNIMSQWKFERQLNWNLPIEDWTPPNIIGDRFVFWVSVAIAILLVVF